MPITPSQPQNVQHQPVVRQMPPMIDKVKFSPPLMKFLEQELKHWKTGLEERKREGEYYLEWLSWRESGAGESELAQTLQQLVRREIASLHRLIDNLSGENKPSDTDQLLAVQHAYLQFCARFDRIKQLILKKIDLKGNIRIY